MKKVIKSWSFYHTKEHALKEPVKTVSVVYEDRKFMRQPEYSAKVMMIDEKGRVTKTRDVGNRKSNTKEFGDKGETLRNVEAWFSKLYAGVRAHGCVQVISGIISDEEFPMEFDCPKYDPDLSLENHHDAAGVESVAAALKRKLNSQGIKSTDIKSLSAAIEKVMRSEENMAVVIDGTSGNVEVVPNADIAGSSDKAPEPEKEITEEEYEALCAKYGRKNMEKLRNELDEKKAGKAA